MIIIDLRETSPNNWIAKYRGNYGIYTIKMITNGTDTDNFSCSCPSDYYPCKHIAMVRNEIKKRITAFRHKLSREELNIESVLKNVSTDELRSFIIQLAKYNQELSNAILLEFSHKIPTKKENNYSSIIRAALEDFNLDDYDLYEEYYDDFIEIDALDQWINKAEEYVNAGNFQEAILICKACIEEYADWFRNADRDLIHYINEGYEDAPFRILDEIVSRSNTFSKELYHYCSTELFKQKYQSTEFYHQFNNLMGRLAPSVDPTNYIEFQNKLLNAISDKKSDEAKRVILRKIDFFKNTQQDDKAWEVIENNIQIESFRRELTEKKIAENKLEEAKSLIMDFVKQNGDYNSMWDELLLTIAQKERDIPTSRRITFLFLENYFRASYYDIYKSTYSSDEWAHEVESLIQHYQRNHRNFNSNVAKVLLAENQTERLMNYVEKYLYLNILVEYYIHFPSPEKTLRMFRQAIDYYAEYNMGRNHYEYIASLFLMMEKIEGGKAVVKEMILQYKHLYKNRRAMMEILGKI